MNRLLASGRRPSTVRNSFFVVRQVLEWAVKTKELTANPAEHLALPGKRGSAIALVKPETNGSNKTTNASATRTGLPAQLSAR
ncbi:hypothetical protein MAUB1S_04894 [Mycolicibacterium aubagnense]